MIHDEQQLQPGLLTQYIPDLVTIGVWFKRPPGQRRHIDWDFFFGFKRLWLLSW